MMRMMMEGGRRLLFVAGCCLPRGVPGRGGKRAVGGGWVVDGGGEKVGMPGLGRGIFFF